MATGADVEFAAAVTAERALALRREGKSYRVIARELGMSPSGVHAAVRRAISEVAREGAEAVRDLEGERLDELWGEARAVLQRDHVMVSQGRVVKGEDGKPLLDDGPKLSAIDRLLKIMERRAKLLGLDAPTDVRVTVRDGVEADIERLANDLGLLGDLADPPGDVVAGSVVGAEADAAAAP